MESLWEATCQLPQFPQLRRDLDTDVLIIGGGLAGVLCARALHRAGIDYALVEAETVGSGVTCNTTAKVTIQHGLCYHKLGRRAEGYYRANCQALEAWRELCRELDCDFQEKDSFVYSLEDRGRLKQEARALEALGADVELVKETALPFPVAGAVRLGGQAQVHPLKFLKAVAQPLRIYEYTPVRQLLGTTALTPQATVHARRVVVATHFPFLNKHGSYFLKMYQHRSYVLALEGVEELPGMYVDEKQTGLSLRSYGKTLLLGGGSHRTGKPGGGWKELEAVAQRFYPQGKILDGWATQDCMTLDAIPYIGPYSASTKGLYVATGFNKWGMTSAMVAAGLLCRQLQGEKSPEDAVFSPSRSILKPQLGRNALHSLGGLLTPTRPRCPHMGCALKWNPQEHSWDCPCHGSRFAGDGTLLEGPATGDL